MAITREMYSQILGAKILGRARKNDSDMIMDATFDEDIQYQIGYFYDYFHDIGEERFRLDDLHPEEDLNKIPIEIKFIRHASQTYNKDPITFWIQFRPSQDKSVISYYDDALGKNKYKAIWPVGMYVDIMAEDGKYNKWLVVNTANYWQNQFPTLEVLKCDYLLQWIHKGKKCECPGVLQSQNSYNSGLWVDYKIQTVEDQQKIAIPLNEITETIEYNKRFLIDSNLFSKDSQPRAWLLSKTKRISPNGICVATFAQDTFDQHHDYVERDESGKVIGMWADYFQSAVIPEDSYTEPTLLIDKICKITYSGTSNQIKVGSSKTFTVTFYEDDQVVDFVPGTWLFEIDGADASDVLSLSYPAQNKARAKFTGGDKYIGKIITVKYTSGEITGSSEVEIIAL